MFCNNCGSTIPDGADICPNCSRPIDNSQANSAPNTPPPNYIPNMNSQQGYAQQPPYQNNAQQYNPNMQYNPYYNGNGNPPYGQNVNYTPASTGLKILCFLFPIIGIILYFVDRDTKPQEGKDCLKMSLIAIGIGVGFYILMIVFALLISFV